MRWKGIIVHHSAGADHPSVEAQSFRDQHRAKGWRDIGYHFVCELVADRYEVVCGRPLNMAGSHCPGVNTSHIGWCFAGDFQAGGIPEAQLLLGAQHIAGLCAAFGIAEASIEPHSARRATLCPGEQFPLARLRELVAGYRD